VTRSIPLTRGLVAVIDSADADLVLACGPWFAVPTHRVIHAQRNVRVAGRWTSQKMHTLLSGWPLVDHVNGDGLDNRRANLRPATVSQNGANVGLRAHNTSGFKGVTWHAQRGRWQARIGCGGDRKHLGLYDSPEDAARAYDCAALAAFGEFARLNFPEGS
jgi:hypothetical protein